MREEETTQEKTERVPVNYHMQYACIHKSAIATFTQGASSLSLWPCPWVMLYASGH